MNAEKIFELLKQDVKVIAQELLLAFEKEPVSVDQFVKTMQPKIEEEKNKITADPTKVFLGGEIEVIKESDHDFGVRISYYLQNNKGEILELSKPLMKFKKHTLIEEEFISLDKDSIKYPIN